MASEAPGPTGPKREYLGWEDANIVEWKVKKELEGRRNWEERWCEFMEQHEKWVGSGINRAFRKPSLRSLEWLKWQRDCKCPDELPGFGECKTRKRVMLQSELCQACRPCPWPITTSAEVGWLSQHKSCQLEAYGNKYMQKPPLPKGEPKISSFLANSQ